MPVPNKTIGYLNLKPRVWVWRRAQASPTARNTAALGFTAVERAHSTAELIQYCLAQTPLQDDFNKFTMRPIHHFSGCLRVTLPPARGASLQNIGGGLPYINTLCTFFISPPNETCFRTERYHVPHMRSVHIQLFPDF
jgi:hypothetical protein